MTISNLAVYGLKNSVRVSKFPMCADRERPTEEVTKNTFRLATAEKGSGHDCFLKGIIVQFDLTASIKMWTQIERYHFFDIVSSMSTMHRVETIADQPSNFNENVDPVIIDRVRELVDKAIESQTVEDRTRLLYSVPVGLNLTAGITTNYLQLKTIYAQRKSHRLKEWRDFCEELEQSLPYSEWFTMKGVLL